VALVLGLDFGADEFTLASSAAAILWGRLAASRSTNSWVALAAGVNHISRDQVAVGVALRAAS